MSNKIRRFFKEAIHPHLRIHRREHRRWLKDNGEALRLDFPMLGPESTVFDIGGYTGGWTDAIHSRYGCTIHVFEPHPRFAADLAAKYSDNDKIHVHAFALGSESGRLALSDEGDASSALSGASTDLSGDVVAVSTFMADFKPRTIDLAKINIEGGEYDLLPALARARQLERFAMLQIQFHMFEKQQMAERDAIRAELGTSHHCDWSYDFVWEQWSRNGPAA
ncbi:FkbM family methyltransferase [Hoeflea sp.]|uniref:FkbM family methyltransferase n=1 Tax=Hoeflea sp. TaxID=1940281 RepID=UPI0019AAC322|nr:FkbM family methyltransferase [Hoeflea sp.]MBC7282753.1 FkbM family methyltransferase [Hoeflea sp.]